MKKALMEQALNSVLELMGKYENMGAKIDPMDPNYKTVKQEVESALNAQDEVESSPVVVATDWAEVIAGLKADVAVQSTISGDLMKEILGEVRKLQEQKQAQAV